MEAIDYVKLFKLDQENYDFKREEFISELGKEFLDYCQTTTIGIEFRLVALAYIPNPNNYPIVCHKDNVVTHNWYKNLYWATQKDNMQQCIRDGRTLKGNKNPMYGISRRGAANPNAKLSKAQRREIRFRYESREKICRLANEFKVSRLTIRRIVNPSLRSFNRLV